MCIRDRPKTLLEYSDWLKERSLRWPAPPKVDPVSASPSAKPMENIRAVTWSIYGTLLRITDGELVFQHPQAIRMEVAIEKTIHEFNMWNSMTPVSYTHLRAHETVLDLV